MEKTILKLGPDYSRGNYERSILLEKRSKKKKDADDIEDFYTEEEIESLLEEDGISTAEEAFMRGYLKE